MLRIKLNGEVEQDLTIRRDQDRIRTTDNREVATGQYVREKRHRRFKQARNAMAYPLRAETGLERHSFSKARRCRRSAPRARHRG